MSAKSTQKQVNKYNLQIIITEQYQLQCQVIENNTIHQIQLPNTTISENCYLPSLTFTLNSIEIGKNEEQSIHFIQDIIENPNEFKLYAFSYQEKEYEVIAEVLFGLVIDKFREVVEKDWIISSTTIILPQNNRRSLLRLNVALQGIGLLIDGDPENDIEKEYNYDDQGVLLEELLDQIEIAEKYRRKLQHAKELSRNEETQKKLDEILEGILTEEIVEKELKSISFKERSEMQLITIDNYCVFIASRYLDKIDDHKHLAFVCRRLKNNNEKFHYNPLSIDSTLAKIFPNMETLHIYNSNDIYFTGGRIDQYVDWIPRTGKETRQIDIVTHSRKVEYKNAIYTRADFESDFEKVGRYWTGKKYTRSIKIPQGINKISHDAFNLARDLISITLPSSIKNFYPTCFDGCYKLTNITIPLNGSRIVFGNKIFCRHPCFDQIFHLPSTIQKINNEEVEQLTSITIPSFVTSLADDCFHGCQFLQSIDIPESVRFIPLHCFEKLTSITEMNIPFNNRRILRGNKIFNNNSHFNQAFYLPSSVGIINREGIDKLTSLQIPSHVTSIDRYCFFNCSYLQELDLPDITSQHFSISLFNEITRVRKITLSPSSTNVPFNILTKLPSLVNVKLPEEYNIDAGDRMMRVHDGCLMSIQIPSTVTQLNNRGYEQPNVFSFTIPTNVTKLADYCFFKWKKYCSIEGLNTIKEFGKCSLSYEALKLDRNLFKKLDFWKVVYGIEEHHRKQLEQWTQKDFSDVVFDTNSDNWKEQHSQFNLKTPGNKNLVFLIEDTTGEMFGYYLDTEMRNICYAQNKTNKNSFQFTLESNGRLSQPMKYEIIDPYWGGIVLGAVHERFLVKLGNIVVNKEDEKEQSFIQRIVKPSFDYHGIPNALCGKMNFNPRRVVVIQMVGVKKSKYH